MLGLFGPGRAYSLDRLLHRSHLLDIKGRSRIVVRCDPRRSTHPG